MNHGQVRYGNAYSPYPYGTPAHNESTTSVSSLASTSSKIMNLFKSDKKSSKKKNKDHKPKDRSLEGPPVPEKDYPPFLQHAGTGTGTSPYVTGNGALPSSSSLSLSLSVSDASGHSASGSTGQRNGDMFNGPASNGLFKLGKGRKKKEKHAENISTPWNVKHEMHVDGGLSGFPPEWQASLIQLGYSPVEIQQMIDQKYRSPAVHTNLIPIGPSASTPAATTSLNTSLLQNQSISLTQLQLQSQSQAFNGDGPSGMRYPSPPQQYALPNLPPQHNLLLQTELGRKQHSNSANSSPVTYAPRPVPVRAGSPAIQAIQRTGSPASQIQRTGSPAAQLRGAISDRSNSPASSTRSHPQHQVSHSLSGSEARASPVPSIRKDASGIGASGLSNSPISNSPISGPLSNPTLKHIGSVTTTIAMGLGSNTMSSSTPTASKPSPTSVQRPVRPPPPPPLFGPSGISTGRANAYKPPTAIAVQGDEDEEEDNLPLDGVEKRAGRESRLILTNAAPGECVSPASATPTSQDMPNITATDLSTVAANSTDTAHTENTREMTTTNADKSTPTTALRLDAPPRLSLGIPRISLELGKLDLGLGPSLSSSLSLDSSDPHQSVDWSESLFSALPSATAFGSFRSSVVLPSTSPNISPGWTPSPTGASNVGRSGSLGSSPVGGTDRAAPAGLNPASANPSPGVSPVVNYGNGRTPSPVAPPQLHNAFASGHSPSTFISTYSPSTFSSARTQQLRHVSTDSSEHIRQLVTHSSTENASEEGADDDGVDRRSIISGDSIASSNVLGHDLLLHSDSHARNTPDMQSHGHDRYRESVSTESTESTSRQSVSSFGVDDDEEGLGMVETVVVARATAVKLARAPSVALRSGFDAIALERRQQRQQQAGVAGEQYSRMQGNGYYGYSGFDEEDEEESDSDEDDSDEEDEDPNSRHTIRLDNVDADRLMDAVMRNHGELDQQLAPGDLGTLTVSRSRPVSTSTVSTSRPISSSTVRLSPSDGPEKTEEGQIVDEEDSSALDDWLEANETEDQVKEESPLDAKSDRSEYDDADYPLSAITASSEKTTLPLHRETEGELNSDSDSDSDYSPNGANDAHDQVDRSATPVAEGPKAAAVHVRSGSASGSGSSHAGSGSTSDQTKRSSMIYVPRPTLSPQLQQVLRPLLSFMCSGDPRSTYSELQQVAEGESGGIYAAYPSGQSSGVVAIKRVKLQEETRVRIETLGRELSLLDGVKHINILSYTAVWLVGEPGSSLDGSAELWIRMEIMDRSLADLLGLLEDGLVIEERHVARFAMDAANALAFLEDRFIAHRDVRSDNLLISGDGMVKLADFATAVQVSKGSTLRNDDAGVIYWQAPEIRRGVYDAMKVDVWSLGATVWELIEGETPFESDPNGPSDRLPEITRTDLQQVSQGLLGFLNLCESPAERRPNARSLLETPFIKAACPRDDVLRLLSQALDIERAISSG